MSYKLVVAHFLYDFNFSANRWRNIQKGSLHANGSFTRLISGGDFALSKFV
jgi:hypothetical protein